MSSSKVATQKVATPRVATPKVATQKVATPKVVTSKVVTPKVATPKVTAPKVTTPKGTVSKVRENIVEHPKRVSIGRLEDMIVEAYTITNTIEDCIHDDCKIHDDQPYIMNIHNFLFYNEFKMFRDRVKEWISRLERKFWKNDVEPARYERICDEVRKGLIITIGPSFLFNRDEVAELYDLTKILARTVFVWENGLKREFSMKKTHDSIQSILTQRRERCTSPIEDLCVIMEFKQHYLDAIRNCEQHTNTIHSCEQHTSASHSCEQEISAIHCDQ